MRYLILFITILLPYSVNAQTPFSSTINESYRYFTVSADADVNIQPNRLSITFGINHRDANLNKGKDKMRKTIKDALAFCIKNGVKEKNIQTGDVSVNTNYNYDNNDKEYYLKIRYYEFSQNFTVILEDLSQYENILYGVLDLGINTVHDVNLYSTDMLKFRNQARLNAIQAAKDKAKLLTEAVGIKLGNVVFINDNTSYYSYGYSLRSNNVSNMSQNISQSGDWNSGNTGDLALGKIPVKASITLTYEIAP